MKKGYLYYYKKWMKTGRMPGNGLCESLPYHLVSNELFKMIQPTNDNEWELCHIDYTSIVYWGAEDYNMYGILTPRRHTILILLAILNGEKV